MKDFSSFLVLLVAFVVVCLFIGSEWAPLSDRMLWFWQVIGFGQ